MIVFRPMTLRSILLAATVLGVPLMAAVPTPAFAQDAVEFSVAIAPPELPVYAQPPMPDAGYIWTPGYWAWSQPVGYYWVPGTWVLPPTVNVLWTPPYWGWDNGFYRFHGGYWGSQVGYYGGVNYGYGYGGNGYGGGRWQDGGFAYNRTVNNFGSVHVQHEYEARVPVVNESRVSYYGGTGGLRTEPTAEQRSAEQGRHMPMTAEQTSHVTAAARTPDLAANRNGGHPTIAASSRPGQFEGAGVVHAAPATANEHAGVPVRAERPAAGVPGARGAANEPGRPAGEAATRPAGEATARPAERQAARPVEPAAARPVQHAAPRPIAPEAARPAEHTAARPVAPAAARPVQHAAARPVEPAAARPVQHAAAPRPVEHAAARPAEARPAPVHVAAAHPAPAPAQGHKEEKR